MRAKIRITAILAVLMIAATTTPSLMAQSLISGDLTGTVTDPSGAVVTGATVMLQSTTTGETRNSTTSSSGVYRFSLLPPGSYTISVSAQGFSKAETRATVSVGQTNIADVKMAVGATSQTVEVTTIAPLVQSDNADLSNNVSPTQVSNLPNGGNDLTYFAQTAPGVTMNVAGGYGNFSANGLPATSNLFTVNGENDMDPYLNLNNSGATNLTLGRNELDEATVISNAYSGQYGQQAGAQVNYVTKSGTNAFHGNAEYWWTGRAMDANDWFNNFTSPTTPRPFANNNEWAASLGGPIKKDKLFFFVNTEGIRYIVPSTQAVYAPATNFINDTLANIATTQPASLSMYQKYFNFFQTAPGYNPNNGTSNSCGDLGPGDPAQGFLNLPGLTSNNCISQYEASPALPGTEWILSGRVDYNVSDKDHLWWRVRMDHGTQDTAADPINPAFSAASYQPAYDGQGQWTHSFGGNATNQFIYAGSYYRAIFTQQDPSVFPIDLYGYGLNLTEVGGGVYRFPQGRNVTQYQFVDDFSWSKGPHSLKFGANFRRYDITDYAFSTYNNPLVYLNSIDDLYNGVVTSAVGYRQRFPIRSTEPVAIWGLGVYGQDEWRVSKTLKLTLALRLEHNSNPVCQLNCASLLTDSFAALAGAGVLSDPTTPYNSIVDAYRHQIFNSTDTINLSPRFGFAWSPGGSDKTVVRGGFGIFYDALPAVIGDNMMTNLPNEVEERPSGVPFFDPSTEAIAAGCAGLIQSGFNQGVSWADVSTFDGIHCRRPTYYSQTGTFHTPYYQQWSFGIQQAIGDKSSLAIGYVGNHGVHIPVLNEGVNAWDAYGLMNSLPSAQIAKMFNVVEQWQSAAVSNYNGLTATFNQRLTYGFTVQANYTWAHAMDEVSNSGSPSVPYGSSSLVYQINPYCLRCNNYSNADYDIRNSFNASYVWQLPYKFTNKYVNGAFGGWTLSQNFFARTGLPYTVLDNITPIAGYGPGSTVAGINQYVNNGCSNGLSQCVPAAFDTYGNLNPIYDSPGYTGIPYASWPNQRRNMYRGPGFFDSDLSINKNFKLTERVAFGVGANFYNIFNHPNFTNPDSNLGDSTFGQITSTTAPPTGPYGSFATGLPSGRIVQLQGKIVF
jgi:hypothetical protein